AGAPRLLESLPILLLQVRRHALARDRAGAAVHDEHDARGLGKSDERKERKESGESFHGSAFCHESAALTRRFAAPSPAGGRGSLARSPLPRGAGRGWPEGPGEGLRYRADSFRIHALGAKPRHAMANGPDATIPDPL